MTRDGSGIPRAGLGPPSAFATLRRFVRAPQPAGRCELCSRPLAPGHQHLLTLASRRLVCACDACALLFGGQAGTKYQRIPRQSRWLPDFQMSDAQWDDLRIPVNMAFFSYSTAAERVLATYPSPAGATESLLPIESWAALVAANPILAALEPNVEALLVNRIGGAREHYLVPIAECYKLVGLIRTHWRGLSGGAEVWQEIGRFFAALKAQASPLREGSHA